MRQPWLGKGVAMTETNQNLESLLERSKSTDVPILLKAKEDNKRKVKEYPSAANLAAFSRSKKMLDEAMSNQTDNKIFPKVADVLEYLQKAGRKTSQAQIYKDIKRGYLRRQPDRSFKQRDVDNYASTLTLIAMPEAKTEGVLDLAEEDLKEKIAKTREQRISIAFDREIKAGKYILREDVALELASRAAALALSLRSVFRLNVADYIRMVGGDVSKAEQLAQEFENNLDMALNEYSKPMEYRTELINEENGEKMEEETTPDEQEE